MRGRIKNLINRLQLLSCFGRDRSGNVALMFGLSLLPVLVLTGAAVDYGRAASERTRLQQALDATTLALPHTAADMSDAQLQAIAAKMLAARFEQKDGAAPTVTVTRGNKTIKVIGAVDVPTSLMRLGGMEAVTVHAEATAGYGGRNIEIALVLDSTFSMSYDNKMATLKTTATNFLDKLAALQPAAGQMRLAMVPYATKVKVGTAYVNASWISLGRSTPQTWTGCVEKRISPYDTQAEPGEPYPAPAYDYSCHADLSPVLPLVDMASASNQATLKSAVANLTPVDNTNITIGMAWGIGMLHPQAPLGASAAPFGSVQKIIILMTDGINITNYTSDTRTLMACANAKAKGIRVITVRLVEGDMAMLKNCASSPSDFYDSTTASKLPAIFDDIYASIFSLRLIN